MGWECSMPDIVHDGITEPCSSLWWRGNGYLASLRTYSSCVLVRPGIELLREGVVDMGFSTRQQSRSIVPPWVGQTGDFYLATRECSLTKETGARLAKTRTHLYGTLTNYQQDTVLVRSLPHSAEWLSSGRSVVASRRANFSVSKLNPFSSCEGLGLRHRIKASTYL